MVSSQLKRGQEVTWVSGPIDSRRHHQGRIVKLVNAFQDARMFIPKKTLAKQIHGQQISQYDRYLIRGEADHFYLVRASIVEKQNS